MIKNKELKKRIIEISYRLGLSHIGSCLTAIDIIDEIYKNKKPDEKFVLSAGHAHLAHLVVMEQHPKDLGEGVYDFKRLPDAEKLIKEYGIHCDRRAGCDVSTGSLGHGIGIALGMALADRSKSVYCLISDGECAEGSVYEALNLASNNLIVYLNDNGYGAYRKTKLDSFIREQVVTFYTNMDDYPEYLQGQQAHYKVLSKKEYEEIMQILS